VTVYRIISAEKALGVSVSLMCQLLGVSRSGYYEWSTRAPSDRELTDAWLTERIKAIWSENREVYGAPRIHAELRMAHGINVGRKRVERLMQRAGISGLQVRKRGRTTVRVQGVRVADDLVERQFRPEQPDVLWIADFSYLRTWEGWLYLAAVQDAFSRRIVGWSMADHMREELVINALKMAVRRRRPDPGLIHHSDQGGQYVGLGFGQACARAGISRSMGSKGDCFDNAVAETFFATIKKELVHRRPWPTRQELTTEVFEYIEGFYNPRRRHSTLGMLSPMAFEEQHAGLAHARAENVKTSTAC
jgi:putative transposase